MVVYQIIIAFKYKMSVGNHTRNALILTSSSSAEFIPPCGATVLRLPRPHGERRTETRLRVSSAQPKSIYFRIAEWGK